MSGAARASAEVREAVQGGHELQGDFVGMPKLYCNPFASSDQFVNRRVQTRKWAGAGTKTGNGPLASFLHFLDVGRNFGARRFHAGR